MPTPFSLGYFSSFGPPAWHAADDRSYGGDWWTGQFYIDLAKRLEDAKFDYLFFEDTLSVSRTGGSMDESLRLGVSAPSHDPVVLLPVLAAATDKIGLIATASTTFSAPYQVARTFATIDNIAGGRAGWNIVTSAEKLAAENFGLEDMPDHTERYDRADEFVEVTRKLWEAWGEQALVRDEQANVYVDSSKVNSVDHKGEHFSVRGPLNVLRSPQGTPLLVQAGASERGKEFAARHAELVFVPANAPLEVLREMRDDIRARAAKHGRNPDDLKVVFAAPVGFSPDGWSHGDPYPASPAQVDAAVQWLSQTLDTDLTQFPLDEPMPVDLPAAGHTSMFEEMRAMARNGMSLVDAVVAIRYGLSEMSFFGTPEYVADRMINFMDAVGGDGLMVMGAMEMNASFLDKLTGELVPALQSAGVIRSEYTGATLRENLWPEKTTAS